MSQEQKNRLSVEALDGYTPEVGRGLWMLEDTRRRTKRDLKGINQAAIDWAPAPKSNSIGTLLFHIVAIELAWLWSDILHRDDYPPELQLLLPYDVRDEQGGLVVVQGDSLEEHLQRMDDGRALFLKSLRGMTTASLRRVHRFEDYEVTTEYTLHHLMQHEAEHRGQINELRMMAERALGKE